MQDGLKFSVIILPYKRVNDADWIYQPTFDLKAQHFKTFVKPLSHDMGVMFHEQLV